MRRHQHDGGYDLKTAAANELRLYRKVVTRLYARSGGQRMRQTLVPWLLALVLLVGPNSPLAIIGSDSVALAAALRTPGTQRGTSGTPNTLGDYLKQLLAREAQRGTRAT